MNELRVSRSALALAHQSGRPALVARAAMTLVNGGAFREGTQLLMETWQSMREVRDPGVSTVAHLAVVDLALGFFIVGRSESVLVALGFELSLGRQGPLHADELRLMLAVCRFRLGRPAEPPPITEALKGLRPEITALWLAWQGEYETARGQLQSLKLDLSAGGAIHRVIACRAYLLWMDVTTGHYREACQEASDPTVSRLGIPLYEVVTDVMDAIACAAMGELVEADRRLAEIAGNGEMFEGGLGGTWPSPASTWPREIGPPATPNSRLLGSSCAPMASPPMIPWPNASTRT